MVSLFFQIISQDFWKGQTSLNITYMSEYIYETKEFGLVRSLKTKQSKQNPNILIIVLCV